MIDFHCHLDLYPDPYLVIEQIKKLNCFILSVTTTPMAMNGLEKLVSGVKGINLAVGLHPELVASRKSDIDKICEKISSAKFIGEIGIDGSKQHKSSLDLQIYAFERIINECERHDGKIISVHSRGAVDIVLDILKKKGKNSKPVLHWFSGSLKQVKDALSLGCWFSIGPAMLQTKKGRDIASIIPQNKVLTETDGPFGINSGERLMPWDATRAEAILATMWETTKEDCRLQLLKNLTLLVGADTVDESGVR